MLNLDPNTTYVIASVYKGVNAEDDDTTHIEAAEVMDDLGIKYQEVDGFYTHTDGKQVHECAFVLAQNDFRKMASHRVYFDEQESVLVLQPNGDDGQFHAMLMFMENYSLPVFLGAWREVKASVATNMPAYSVHGGTYYVAA